MSQMIKLGGKIRIINKRNTKRIPISSDSSFDCLDVNELTQAEIEGRQQSMYALAALKKVVPGFEKAKLRNFGMTIGVRDSRKIVGK